MKNLLRYGICLLLMGMFSCSDHLDPQVLSCDEVGERVFSANWLLTSKTRNNVNVILPCEKLNRLVFGAPRFPNQYAVITGCSDQHYGGTWSCNKETVTLLYDTGSQTLKFVSPTSFLLIYSEVNGDVMVETYVKQ